MNRKQISKQAVNVPFRMFNCSSNFCFNSLPSISKAQHHIDFRIWGSPCGDDAEPSVLGYNEFTPWTKGWVGSRVDHDALKKRKIVCPWRKSNIISWSFITQPSHYTGWATLLHEFQTQSYSTYKSLASNPKLRTVGKHRYDNYCPRSQPCDVRGHGSISGRS